MRLIALFSIPALVLIVSTDVSAQRERDKRQGAQKFSPQQVFSRFDRNRDGKLSKNEVPKRMAENFGRVDGNGDGFIDQTELQRAMQMMAGQGRNQDGRPQMKKPGGDDGRRQQLTVDFLLRRSDKNSDGKLSKEEAPEKMRERFEIVDQDGDGFVDRKELEQIVKRFQEMNDPNNPAMQRRDRNGEIDTAPKHPKRPPSA